MGIIEKLKSIQIPDIWEIDADSLSPLPAAVIRILRVAHLVVRGFREDELPIRASALTFATLMSLVPFLAIAFSFMKGFGVGQEKLVLFMEAEWIQSMPPEFQEFINQVFQIVQNTNVAALGWFGAMVLLLTAIMVLSNVEVSFNRVWGITTSRNPMRRAANYISILVVFPILMGIASTLSATLGSEAMIARLGTVGFIYRSFLKLSPLFSAWFAFGFLYVFLPNTKVKLVPALVSGLVGALMWLFWQNMYISLQVGVARYNAIYGTFASVPIFLAWLYVSWVIILLGAEVAFATQNQTTFHLEQRAADASLKARIVLGFSIILEGARCVTDGRGAFDAAVYAKQKKISIRLLNDLLKVFVESGWMAEVADQQGVYVLLKAPATIHLRDIVDVLVNYGESPDSLGVEHVDQTAESILQKFDQGLDSALSGKTLDHMLGQQTA